MQNCADDVQRYNKPINKNFECSIKKISNNEKENVNDGKRFIKKNDRNIKKLL